MNVSGYDALTRAQGMLDGAALRIAKGPATPKDMVDLMQARNQFAAGTKVVKTQDEMTRKLLDVFG